MNVVKSAKVSKYGSSYKAHVSNSRILVINVRHKAGPDREIESHARKLFEHKGKVVFQ